MVDGVGRTKVLDCILTRVKLLLILQGKILGCFVLPGKQAAAVLMSPLECVFHLDPDQTLIIRIVSVGRHVVTWIVTPRYLSVREERCTKLRRWKHSYFTVLLENARTPGTIVMVLDQVARLPYK